MLVYENFEVEDETTEVQMTCLRSNVLFWKPYGTAIIIIYSLRRDDLDIAKYCVVFRINTL